MIGVWTLPDGSLLVRRTREYAPFFDEAQDRELGDVWRFERVAPETGAILETFRRECAWVEGEPDLHAWTVYQVVGAELQAVSILVRHLHDEDARQSRVAGRHATLTGLAPHTGRRWETADGLHLVEGAPQTTTYGSNPPCELIEGVHDYFLVDPAAGEVHASWLCSAVITIPHSDEEDVTRHRIEDGALVEYVFAYTEDSCWGVGRLRGHRRRVVLEGLVPLEGA